MNKQFKRQQYDYQIIIEALGLCYHFSLNYRDSTEIRKKFSIGVHHTTIYRWDKQYGKASIIYGRNALSDVICLNPGGLMKPMSRLKEKIVIFIVRLIPTGIH